MSGSRANNSSSNKQLQRTNAVRVVAFLIAVAAPLATAQNPLSTEKGSRLFAAGDPHGAELRAQAGGRPLTRARD